jgi:indole-3-glycerol phosphate synthase
MSDFLDVLARDAKETVNSGYYEAVVETPVHSISLKNAIQGSRTAAVITEIKAASPSLGTIREDINVAEVAKAMAKGGAAGISVLTEPKHFHGSLRSLAEARMTVNLPILMKDIIISPLQLEAASKIGANAALLIVSLLDRGYCELGMSDMITEAHSRGLEVLLETHSEDEFRRAVDTDADLVGINNRNLATLTVDLHVTERILNGNDKKGKAIVSESGIKAQADLRFLRGCGADAFLVGSAVMAAGNLQRKVRELVLTP